MLERHSVTIPSVALNTAIGTTAEIRVGTFSGGIMYLLNAASPAGAAAVTTLTWWAADRPGGTYHPAYDEDGVAVTQTVAHTRACAIPASLFAAVAIKAVVNAAGTVSLTLKA